MTYYPKAIKVYIDFDHGALPGANTWTEVTDYVCGQVRFEYGRQSAVDDFQPGRGSLTLDNRDGRFDPSNTVGPYYGKLKQRRRLKIEVSFEGVNPGDPDRVFGAAFGWIDGWPIQQGRAATSYVNLTFTDALALLSRLPLPDSPWNYVVQDAGPWAWYQLNDDSEVATDSSGNGRHGKWVVFEGSGEPVFGLPLPKSIQQEGVAKSVIPGADRPA